MVTLAQRNLSCHLQPLKQSKPVTWTCFRIFSPSWKSSLPYRWQVVSVKEALAPCAVYTPTIGVAWTRKDCRRYSQWCIAKNGGGYTQRGVAKGLKVPCLFMITEVCIRCQKTRRLVYGVYPRIPPNTPLAIALLHIHYETNVCLDKVVDIFAKKHPRRIRLETLLKD